MKIENLQKTVQSYLFNNVHYQVWLAKYTFNQNNNVKNKVYSKSSVCILHRLFQNKWLRFYFFYINKNLLTSPHNKGHRIFRWRQRYLKRLFYWRIRQLLSCILFSYFRLISQSFEIVSNIASNVLPLLYGI